MPDTCSPRALRRHTDRLMRLARVLVRDPLDEDNIVVLVCDDPSGGRGGTLAVVELEGRHPLDLLMGLDAGADIDAVGVSATGRGTRIDDAGDVRAVRVVVLVHRSGAAVTAVRHDGGTMATPGAGEGALADACSRALGVPTAPPPYGSGLLWALAWLDAIVEAAGEPIRRPADPERLARLHVAWKPGTRAAELAAQARNYTRLHPWSRLRDEPWLLPSLAYGSLDPVLAAWMDDGMLARWSLGAYPDLSRLVRDVEAIVGDDAAIEWLGDVIEAGLDATPP